MKRRIKFFFETYFFFNRQESKGLLSLLLLIILVQFGSILYANYSKTELPSIKNIPIEELNILVDKESDFEDDDFSKSNFPSKGKSYASYTHKYVPKTYKKDSVYIYPVKPKLGIVDINVADSATLVALPKIGPVLAGRIIQYRNKLGGFHSYAQLNEVWGFKEDILFDLEGKVSLNPQTYQRINLNTASLEELKKHPYFKFTLSQALVNYRKQHGAFESVSDLKKIKLVNDSILNLISPYCSF